MTEKERIPEQIHVQNHEVLVASDFGITPHTIKERISYASSSEYPEYPPPQLRLKMTNEEIKQWQEKGSKTADLPPGNYTVMIHPNYLKGVTKGTSQIDDGKKIFSPDEFLPTIDTHPYTYDERGIPIRPFDTDFLKMGALNGFGFYRHYGPNRTADPVVFREVENSLQVLLITRRDTGVLALPGGMQDPQEPDISTATREFFEEAGIDLKDTPAHIIYKGIVWSDTRSTRNAWPESTVVLLTPDPSKTDKMIPTAGDDAKKADWEPLSKQTLGQMFTSHADFIKLSVLKWQELTGKTVYENGSIR